MTRSRLFLILLAATVLAVVAGAATWRHRVDIAEALGVASSLGLARPAPIAVQTHDPLGGLDPDARALLTAPAPVAPSPFLRRPWISPDAFCKALEAVGFKGVTFQQGEPPQRSWTCLTDVLKPVDGDEAAVSSLFFTARGAEGDRIDGMRLKLNLLDPATTPAVKAVAKDLLRLVFRALGWEPPQALLDAIDASRDEKIEDHGVAYDLRREFGEPPRHNLIVTFPRGLGPGGVDRFLPLPRRPAQTPFLLEGAGGASGR
jgi:hypothetical protein